MGRRRRTAALALTASLAFGQLLVAVAYALAARSAPVELFGQTAAVIASAAVLSGVVDFGLASFLLRELASGRMVGTEARARLIGRLALIGCATIVAIASAIAVSAAFSGSLVQPVITACVLIVGTIAMQSAQVKLRARGRLTSVAIATVVDRAALLGTVVVGINLGVPVLILLPVAITTGLVADTLICLFLSRTSPLPRPLALRHVLSPKSWTASWRGTRAFGAASLTSSLQQIDVTLLAALGGASATGEYGAVSRWTLPLTLPSTAVTQTEASATASAANTMQAIRALGSHGWIYLVSVAASVLVACFATPIASFVLGSSYRESGLVLTVLAVGVIPTVFAQPLSMLLQNRGQDSFVAYVLAFGLALRLACVITLASGFGALAAAWAVLVQQSIVLIVLAWKVVRLARSEN